MEKLKQIEVEVAINIKEQDLSTFCRFHRFFLSRNEACVGLKLIDNPTWFLGLPLEESVLTSKDFKIVYLFEMTS